MSKQESHIVKNQIFDISIEYEKDAYTIQSGISLLQKNKLQGIIDNVLTRFSSSNCLYQFDVIDLDLGVVSMDNFEQEIPFKIEEELTKFLNHSILSTGNLRTGKKVVWSDEGIDQLEHFLLYGHFKWNYNNSLSIHGLLDVQVRENKNALVAKLKSLGKSNIVRQRMINQFSDTSLENLVGVISKDESHYIVSYKKAILEQHKTEKVVEAQSRPFTKVIWDIILAYLFLESNSYYNKKKFLEYLIRKIANKYNLSYSTLLSSLVFGVESIKNDRGETDFKKMLLELNYEHESISEGFKNKTNTISFYEYFNALSNYLLEGDFKSSSGITSKHHFLNLFKTFLINNNKSLEGILNSFLSDSYKRSKLLHFLDTESISLLADKIEDQCTRNSLSIFELFKRNLKYLPSHLHVVFETVYRQRSFFVLKYLYNTNYSADKVVEHTLQFIWNEMKHEEKGVLDWIDCITVNLSNQERKEMTKFVKKIHRENVFTEDNNIKDIVRVLLDFINSNEKETWYYWIADQFEKWVNKTDLSTEELKKKIITQLNNTPQKKLIEHYFNVIEEDRYNKEDVSETKKIKLIDLVVRSIYNEIKTLSSKYKAIDEWNEAVLSIIEQASQEFGYSTNELIKVLLEHYKGGENSIQLVGKITKIEELLTLEHQSTKERRSHLDNSSKINYVFEKGVLPWWIDTYTWLTFNKELELACKFSESKKQIQLLLSKTKYIPTLIPKLSIENIIKLWQLMDSSAGLWKYKVLRAFHYFLFYNVLPVNILSKMQYEFFLEKTFEVLKDRSSSLNVLFDELGLWMRNQFSSLEERKKHIVYSDLLAISDYTQNIHLKKWLRGWLEENEKSIGYFSYDRKHELIYLLESSNVDFYKISQSLLKKNKKGDLSKILLFDRFFKEIVFKKLSEDQLFKLFSELLSESQQREFGLLKRGGQIEHAFNTINKSNQRKEWDELVERIAVQEDKSLNQDVDYTYILDAVKNTNQVNSLVTQIKTLDTTKLMHLLVDNKTRSFIIEKFKEDELQNLVVRNFNSEQKEHFKKTIRFISLFSNSLSVQEYQKLFNTYYNLILKKMALGNSFVDWKTDNWMRLLIQSLDLAIGKIKRNVLFHKVCEASDVIKPTDFIDDLEVLVENVRENISIKKEPVSEEEKKSYKKLGEEELREFIDPIYVKNAGLIILSPYLKMLFEKCELYSNDEFKDVYAQHKAVHLLAYAATGKSNLEEHELVINKLLCGVAILDSIDKDIELSEQDKATVNGLLKAVIQQWSVLKGTSVEGLQESFLQRNGKLEEEEEQYYLKVEQKAFDMLLDQIPWNIGTLKMSWMKKMLVVEWR